MSVTAGRVVLAIARFEGRRLVRHPFVFLSAAAGPLMLLARTWDLVPLLHTDDAVIAESALPLAIMTLLVVNAALLRQRRIVELRDASPASRTTLTLGYLGSLAAAAVLALAVVAVDLIMLVALAGSGAPNMWELITGPVIVVLAGTIGVALGAWLPARVVALPAAAGLLALAIVTAGHQVGSLPRWLGAYVPPADIIRVPRALDPRPVAAHALYLAGIAAALATIALVRTRMSSRRFVALAVSLSLAVGGVGLMRDGLSGADEFSLRESLIAQQVCSSDTCLHPAYEQYRAAITRVVDRLQAVLPDGASPPTVVQDLIGRLGIDPDAQSAALVGLRWGRGQAVADYEFGLALQLAVGAVGMPAGTFEYRTSAAERRFWRERFDHEIGRIDTTDQCWAIGEARAVLALWLAARVTPGAEEYLRREASTNPVPPRVSRDEDGVLVQWCCDAYYPDSMEPGARPLYHGGVITGPRELAYAAALLDRPDDVVYRSWDRVVDPSTTTEQAVTAWGLTPIPTAAEVLLAAGLDPGAGPGSDDSPREPRCRDVEVPA